MVSSSSPTWLATRPLACSLAQTPRSTTGKLMHVCNTACIIGTLAPPDGERQACCCLLPVAGLQVSVSAKDRAPSFRKIPGRTFHHDLFLGLQLFGMQSRKKERVALGSRRSGGCQVGDA